MAPFEPMRRAPHGRRLAAALLSCTLLAASVPPIALAGPIDTERALDGAAARQRVDALLLRDDLQAALAQRGVDPAEARLRVAALSDAEVDRLVRRLDELAAGGDLIGAAFTVFVILLITDVLGFTKIFPFTRSIR